MRFNSVLSFLLMLVGAEMSLMSDGCEFEAQDPVR